MPDPHTVTKWRRAHPDFDADYTRAREDQMHSWADDIVSLIDGAAPGKKVKVKLDSEDLTRIENDGWVTFVFEREFLQHAIAKVDVRKWLMSKILPVVFGDRLQVEANHTFEKKDDAEIMTGLGAALSAAGITTTSQLIALGRSAGLKDDMN